MAFGLVAGVSGWLLANHDYETEYLALGNLVVRGELNLYQPEMSGQWVPLPFVVFGFTQAIVGPSLLAARLLAVVLGLGVVWLVFAIGSRWGGPVGGAIGAGLFCTNGLVVGYFATAHFSPLAAIIHLLGIYVLFCTDWRWRDLVATAVFSLLFLVKPHYWPTIPFVLAYLVARPSSHARRGAVVALSLAVPLLFFASDVRHWKLFAYMPIIRDWTASLGYSSWHSLMEDSESIWSSDYVTVAYSTSIGGRLVAIAQSFGFFLKRYAIWCLALGGLAVLNLWTARREPRPSNRYGTGFWFTLALFWYLVACQFIIVGPYVKQGFAYVGAIAPLLAIVLGCLFARVSTSPVRIVRAAALAGIVGALVLSPWVHRSHDMPRSVSLSRATIPRLDLLARELARVIPADAKEIFLLGDAMPLYLAGRRPYLQQFHEHLMMFTSVRDPRRYERSGLWGYREIDAWLGSAARYAVIEPQTLEFYRGRAPYREHVERIETLLRTNFGLLATVSAPPASVFLVYRRTS
ncbi:MAG: hypothetical protein DME04_18025 [Candidatus Rokuibacteriota bacterium]|nr:MAG: hypothetical protein DME04_18025 [Candidatus Rokubacteria bacterium]